MAHSIDLDWGAFFARYEVVAVRFVRGLVRDADLAEDLFQEAARAVFERSRRAGTEFDSPAHARNYLFRVLRNLAVDAVRAPERRARTTEGVELESAPWEPSDELEARERASALRAALAGLRPEEREAVAQRYFQCLPYREMAARSGAAISTLQARVEAALGKIRDRVGKRLGAE